MDTTVKNNDKPVIMLGMHRSGTSILSKSLSQMGLFTGAHLDSNDEAFFFLKINQWLLKEMGGSWDNPMLVNEVLEDDKLRALYIQILRKELNSMGSLSYLGIKRYARSRSIFNMTGCWGWKDPRNVFTLPIWMELFPNARVLHISRDGRDVARSIIERRTKRINSLVSNNNHVSWLVKTRIRFRGFGDTLAVSDHNKAIALWGLYEKHAVQYSEVHKHNFMHLKYEELLKNPMETLKTAGEFCDISFTSDQLALAANLIDGSKSGMEKRINDEEITSENRAILSEHGYQC